jgi:hypothetical protein
LNNSKESVTGNKGKPHPATFEFTHNNVILCYRVFYRGLDMDPTFPPPVVRQLEIPDVKPKIGFPGIPLQHAFVGVASTANVEQGALATAAAPSADQHEEDDDREVDLTGIVGGDEPHEERRSLLREVREHLDLLREFEGVISQEEINKRKRELFLSLPPAPPPAMGRKGKKDGTFASLPPSKKLRENDAETSQG